MKKCAGFSMIELVIVILILGILAVVAAPKLQHKSAEANEKVLMKSLRVVRDAITLYSANNAGELPGADNQEATFKADLARYLRKFPENPLSANPAKSDRVRMIGVAGPLDLEINNDEGWIYNSKTGEFLANSDDTLLDGVRKVLNL